MLATSKDTYPRLTLHARTAEDLMTRNPVSLAEDETLREALALFTDRGIKAAPVIDAAGRPVGVVSSTDLLIHDRECVDHLRARPEFYQEAELLLSSGDNLKEGFEVERVDKTRVREVMTPTVFAVAPDTPAPRVIEDMVAYKVHRLFVVDDSGVLVGVISALDVLRHLAEPKGAEAHPRR
jgi:CBS domain-containing protein